MSVALAKLEAAFASRQPEAYRRLTKSPTTQRYTSQVLIHSRFLADAILQHPEWVEELAESESMYRALGAREYQSLLDAELADGPVTALVLARFRRRQLLRILLRDVLLYGTLGEVTGELSYLADTIIGAALRSIEESLATRHGRPDTGFAVIALGKLGGLELNYSSDIDLMFLYGENGETTGPQPVSYKEYCKKTANELTNLLSTYTPEGLCYRVDLRLRPEGSLGDVAISLEGARNYYQNRARDWELQMMIKARVAAGDRPTGAALLDFVEPLTYSTTLDFQAIEVMSATRERLNEKLSAKRTAGNGGVDVKLAPGGIRDIEFLVQCLQRLHGGRFSWLRHGGTLLALSRLRDKELISTAEYSYLASAYQFLRMVEHRLQLVDDRQTHRLPASPDEFALLAARMPEGPGYDGSPEAFTRTLEGHLERVRDIYARVVHAQKLDSASGQPGEIAARRTTDRFHGGHRPFEQFLERAAGNPAVSQQLNQDRELTRIVIEIFESSPYFAEQLIRMPDLVLDLHGNSLAVEPPSEPAAMRRYYTSQMMRLQSRSICDPVPIFETLNQTSDLADRIIARAYRTAVEQMLLEHPPKQDDYAPAGQMMVIALGRLGMREFDLASDADLNFVVPEEDRSEIIFWTRVAERVIQILSAYTGQGVIFSVDTRLRPDGREGALVQTDTGYYRYFEHHADAWEGIAYMKARAVAGDIESGTEFLGNLQSADWRRWGQSGRSREVLRDMRMKVEREQGAGHPLKAGFGGYYDIDFILMYLRLKSAGIFYQSLNTPERLDVLEKMGQLSRDDASFLSDAATFYRAIDHGLRLSSGQAEGRLPASEVKLAALAALVARWIPERLREKSLELQLDEIKDRTRRLFARTFP